MRYFSILIFFTSLAFTSCKSHSNSDSYEFSNSSDYTNTSGLENSNSSSENNNDGRIQCSICSGSGNVTCDICEGNGKKHCDDCAGDGWDNDGTRCLNCDGGGIVQCNTLKNCSACNGYGYGYLVPCSMCNGTAKKEDGTSCLHCLYEESSILNVGSSMLMGMIRNSTGDKGVILQDYPGYFFNPPNNVD